MNFTEMYNAKKCSPEAAVSLIKSGDRVFTGGSPIVLYQALYENRENIKDVKMYAQFGMMGKSGDYILSPEMVGHVSFACTTLALSSATNPWPKENLDQLPLSFSLMERLIETMIKPDAVLLSGGPMDDEGYINMGTSHGCTRTPVDLGAKVIVQVNEELLCVPTDYYRVHISEVDALVEAVNPKEGGPGGGGRQYGEKEEHIAAHIIERIRDGSTIQLGAGGVPNAVGAYLKDHKNLGIHAETIVESLITLMQSGVVNNSQKPLMRGVSVAGFFGGSPRTFDYIQHNPAFMLKKLSWVNDPMVVCQIPNMVSVNSCLAADLRGQVCSESLAMGNTGGVGGQLDFVEGARKAPGGQTFLAMHSSVTTRSGEKVSKITLTLPMGSVVTTPASDVMFIATEYGVAELQNRSARERARNLIAIADPEFRDSLTFEAKKCGLL